MERIQVFYSGRVQGVGFRFTVQRLAEDLGLRGWVKNLPDGRVELVCEGERQDLEQVLARIDGEFRGYLRQKNVSWLAFSGGLDNFEIRF